MIDQTSSIWLQGFEDQIISMGGGNDKIRIIDSSTVQEDNINEGMFVFRSGLCGHNSSVSVESKLEPGRFLRHQNGRIRLQSKEDNDGFRKDSCFYVVADECPNGGFALQSVNNRDKFVQMLNRRVIQKFNDLDMFIEFDHSFKESDVVLMQPMIYLQRFFCWANPVSQQANLAFCLTKVTQNDDLYEHPECCNHEETLENFGECCKDLENIGGCSIPQHNFCQHLFRGVPSLQQPGLPHPSLQQPSLLQSSLLQSMIQKHPQCCKVAYKIEQSTPGAMLICRQPGITGLRIKRQTAACTMPCWQISHCVQKMRIQNWENKGYENCCCHPYRNSVMKPNGLNYVGTCPGLD